MNGRRSGSGSSVNPVYTDNAPSTDQQCSKREVSHTDTMQNGQSAPCNQRIERAAVPQRVQRIRHEACFITAAPLVVAIVIFTVKSAVCCSRRLAHTVFLTVILVLFCTSGAALTHSRPGRSVLHSISTTPESTKSESRRLLAVFVAVMKQVYVRSQLFLARPLSNLARKNGEKPHHHHLQWNDYT